jgi:hypothetical protein
MGGWVLTLATAITALAPTGAAAQGDGCLTADPPPVTRPAHALRFGITPGMAGSAGAAQEAPRPIDPAATVRALQDLRPPRRQLVLRLNRLFWSEGSAGIRRFAADVDRYGAAGLLSEIQVRYHPPVGRAGDIAAWEAFVREAVRAIGPKPSVTGFTITNEANFPTSPNTSDGAYPGVIDALVRGVAVAGEELERLGRGGLDVGFNVMWRYTPDSDRRFWEEIGSKATPAFRRALTNVGVQVYPGLVWPPAPRPGVSAGEEVVEALTLVRRCFMPKAALGDDVQLWVSENGYATNLGRSEGDQAVSLDSTVRAVHRWSGELGITDYRWFNLRDNVSNGRDLFSAVGLLRDDYGPKPAFAGYRGLIGLFGADVGEESAGGSTGAGSPEALRRTRARLAVRVSPRRDARGARRFTTRGRVIAPAGVPRALRCRGVVAIRFKAGQNTISVRRARLRRDCTFASRVTFRVPRRFAGRRALRVRVVFEGNARLLPARAAWRRVQVR